MKLNRLFLALIITFSLVACSKDKNDASSGVQVNFDGKNTDLSLFARAELTRDGDISSLEIFGTDKESYGNIVAFNIASEAEITAKKYTHGGTSNETAIGIAFKPEGRDTDFYYGGLDSEKPFSITISSISDTNVQGSFEGQVELDNVTKNISGNFNLPIQR